MKKLNALIAATALTAFSLPGLAADPAHHSHDHPLAKRAQKTAPSKPSKEAISEIDARMKEMQAMHEKMMAAKTPEARRAMMPEHLKSMHDGMSIMDKSAGGMGMKKDGGMNMKKSGGANMSHELMEKRIDMMQQMMKMMMERMAAGETVK